MNSIGRFVEIAPGTWRRPDGLTVKESVTEAITVQWDREDDSFIPADNDVLFRALSTEEQKNCKLVVAGVRGTCFCFPRSDCFASWLLTNKVIDFNKLLPYLDQGMAFRDLEKPKADDMAGRVYLLEKTVETLQEAIRLIQRKVDQEG